jgi:hypothetical protein
MKLNQAWSYSGGVGLAGAHMEDSFLDFTHHNLHFKLTMDAPPEEVIVYTVVHTYMYYTALMYYLY